MKNQKITIFSDGGSRGNPGPAGCGAVLYNSKKEVIVRLAQYIGKTTNNQAEYRALIIGLEKAQRLKAQDIICYLDSELVVKQLNREYRVKDKDLETLFVKVHNLTLGFKSVTFKHIRREKNKEADRLVNLALDKALKK
ncbi:MAG: ribonuclease HI family protein [Parcubacteria group bacterium]|nr:ribonuclease HI family protein [Parcubacteria group bacterium]